MRHAVDYIRKHPKLLLLIVLAFFFHMLVIIPSGSMYCFGERCGLYFWGAHNHDAVWHLAIVNTAFRSFPFAVPTFAGAPLSGYNILLDLVIFLLQFIGLPPLFSYFKLLPLVWFVLFTWVAIMLARSIKDSPVFVGLFLFFCYFGSSFSYIFTLYHKKTLAGSSAVLAMQSGLMLTNVQLAFSFVVMMAILLLLRSRKFTFRHTILLGLYIAITIGLKFYGGVIALFLAGLYLIEVGLSQQSWMAMLKHGLILGVMASIAIILLYNPFASLKSGSVFAFVPLATVRPIIEDKSLFYLKDTVNARYYLQASGRIGPRLIGIELMTLFLYLFFNFGTRCIGFMWLIVQAIRRRATRFDLYLFLSITLATGLSILLVQKGEWWNTVQFLYYALFLANIVAAQGLYSLWKKKNHLAVGLVFVFLFLTLPANFDILKEFTSRWASYISPAEIEALNFLRKQSKGVVLDAFERDFSKQYSFYTYDNTSYVSAFTSHPTYVGDLVQLRLLGVDYAQRLKQVKARDCSVMKTVDYLYVVHNHKQDYLKNCQEEVASRFRQSFKNKEVTVYMNK